MKSNKENKYYIDFFHDNKYKNALIEDQNAFFVIVWHLKI